MRIKTRTIVIMLTQGVSQACKIALGMIIVRMLAKAEVGSYRQAFLVYTFLGSLLSLHLESSLYYFVPQQRKTRLAGLLLQTFGLTTMMSLGIAVVMFLGASSFANLLGNPEIVPLIQILCLYPFGEKMLLLVPSFMISQDRAVHAGVYTMFGAVMRIVLVVSVLSAGGDLALVFKWLVGFTCVLGVVGLFDMLRFSRGTQAKVSWDDLREQLAYCLPLLVNSGVAVMNLQFDKFLVSNYFDVATFAIYSCGAMDLPMITLVTSSLTNAIMPNLVEMTQKGNYRGTVNLWQKAMRKAALVIFPCFVFFFVIGRDFMILLYSESYAEASWPFRVYLCGLPIRIAVYSALLRALGKTRPIAVSAMVGLVSNVVVSSVLITVGQGSLLSFMAPALGTIVSYFTIAGYCLWVISKHLNRPISDLMGWGTLARLMGLFILAAIPLLLVDMLQVPLIVSMALKGILFFLASAWLLHITRSLLPDELEMIGSVWSKVRKIVGR